MKKPLVIVIFSLIKYTPIVYEKIHTEDERCDMINSKSYKLGYLLYEFSLLIFIGTLINSSIHQNGKELIQMLISTLTKIISY